MRNIHNLSLAQPFIAGMLCWLALASTTPIITASQQKREDKDWTEIERLHERGWEERDKQNFGESEKIFQLSARKAEKYRSSYIKDRNSLAFLNLTYRLGYLNELGNKDEKARGFYEQCLVHPTINSSEATFDGKSILEQTKDRLKAIEQRMQSSSKRLTGNYPRISVKGGSKGSGKDLPTRSLMHQP